MIEKVIPYQFAKIELPAIKPYVVVNAFEAYTLSKFMEDCSNALKTGQQFLPVVIDSYGGSVHTLLAMVDFLESVEVPVITVSQGKSMSAGAVLFSCGEERYISKTSTIMIHEVSSACWGKNVEFQNSAKETERLNDLIFSMMDKNTGKPERYWKNLIHENGHADLFLTASDAIKHGLATCIGIPYIETSIEVKKKIRIKGETNDI